MQGRPVRQECLTYKNLPDVPRVPGILRPAHLLRHRFAPVEAQLGQEADGHDAGDGQGDLGAVAAFGFALLLGNNCFLAGRRPSASGGEAGVEQGPADGQSQQPGVQTVYGHHSHPSRRYSTSLFGGIAARLSRIGMATGSDFVAGFTLSETPSGC